MEIVITHTIHPDVIALFKSFISPGNGGQIASPEQIATPVAETVKAPKQKAVAPKAEAPKIETKSETPAAEGKKIEFTDIRQLYMQKKEDGKQELVKKILDEYGVEKLSQFKPEQFEEVYNKIKAL